MHPPRHKQLAGRAVIKKAGSGTSNRDPEQAVSRDLPLGGLPRGNSGLHFPPHAGRGFGRAAAPALRLSLVAGLAILAIIAAWLATVARWHSGSVFAEQSHGMTVYRFVTEGSRSDRILRLFALLLFAMAGGLGALGSWRPRLPVVVVFLFVAMILYSVFWCLVGYTPSEYWPDLIGTTSPLIFTMCLGVFAGAEPTLWPKLKPVTLAISYGSCAFAAYYTARLTVKGSFAGSNPTIDHLQVAFWFGLFALVLRKSSRWQDCWPALIPIAICIPIAIVAASRSFTLLAILGLLTGLMIPFQSHERLRPVRLLALGLTTIVLLALALWLLSLAAPERVQALRDRVLEDTRTGQYTQFFQQVPVTRLITGLGPKATYSYNDRPDYDYIDNQFLFILFKFGLPVLLGYCAVVVWPGLRLLIHPGARQQRLVGFVFAFWTLATLGLSIYHSIWLNPQNLVMVLLAGQAFALAKTTGSPPFPRSSNLRRIRSQSIRQTAPGTNLEPRGAILIPPPSSPNVSP